MNGCLDEWMNGCLDEFMFRCLDECVSLHACVVCLYNEPLVMHANELIVYCAVDTSLTHAVTSPHTVTRAVTSPHTVTRAARCLNNCNYRT